MEDDASAEYYGSDVRLLQKEPRFFGGFTLLTMRCSCLGGSRVVDGVYTGFISLGGREECIIIRI